MSIINRITDFYMYKPEGTPITKGEFEKIEGNLDIVHDIVHFDEDNQVISFFQTKDFGYFLENLSGDFGKEGFLGYLIENYNFEPDTDVQQLQRELFREMYTIASIAHLTILECARGDEYLAEQFKNAFLS